MEIPVGFATTTLTWTGPAVRFPASIILGWDLDAYSGSAADLAGDVLQAANDELMDHMDDGVILTSVLAKFGPTASGPSAIVSGSTGGGAVGQGAAANLAFLVHKHTALGGRRGRGRFYLPGVSEGSVSEDGTIDGGTLTAVESDVTSFFNAVIANLATPVLLHGDEPAPMAPTPILSFTVDGIAGTQRRRMRR